MGQKVNPVGMRIGINRDWNTHWYANNKDFSTYLLEDIAIRKYITKVLNGYRDTKNKEVKSKDTDPYLSHIEIDRVKNDKGQLVTIKIFVAVVGIVIGKDNVNLNALKKGLSKVVKSGSPRVEIVEVKNPDLDAHIVAQRIANQLENRVSFRIAQKKAIRNVMKSGAKGIKTLVSGRLNGAEIARSEGYTEGKVPRHTLRADIDYAIKEADTIYGKIGVKVWIYKGEILGNGKKEEKVRPSKENKGGVKDGSNTKKN